MKKIILTTVGFYRNYLARTKLECCRFYPSCSVYAADAVEKHGVAAGVCKAAWRLLRCNPFSKGGYDPA